MNWTKEIPKIEGGYWFRNLDAFWNAPATVLMVRMAGDELVVDNCAIDKSNFYCKGEWAGPIPLPEEIQEPKLVQCDYAQRVGCSGMVKKRFSRCPHSVPHIEHSLGLNEDSCEKASCWVAKCEVQCKEITD